MKRLENDNCPICGKKYEQAVTGIHRNVRTKHHVFPKRDYGPHGVKIEMCWECHHLGFHQMFPMGKDTIWHPYQCVQYLKDFCESKGKNAYEIYPVLKTLQPMR